MDHLRIAQVAPLHESVPPKLYGGTERIVSYLTEELVRRGHDVTLFASGDSVTRARLRSVIPDSLRLKENCEDALAPHIVQLQEVMESSGDFDLIHFHTDYLNFPFSQNLPSAHLTTLHGKLTIPELQLLYHTFSRQPLVSISNAQRTPLPQANFIATVYHGIPDTLFSKGEGQGNYLAFLGRISPEKRCDRAIEIAKAANMPLKIAAKVDKADAAYFEEHIKHLLDDPLVEFMGEINEEQKQEFLGHAAALLFPIDWPEPFGLVMIEAMACGTPVIGWQMGSVPEIIEDGRNGLVVHSMEAAIDAVKNIGRIDRNLVRKIFEERFSAQRMTSDYLDVYKRLIAERREIKQPNHHKRTDEKENRHRADVFIK